VSHRILIDEIATAAAAWQECRGRTAPFPKKFKHLLEPDPPSVPRPDYLWLSHAVCACDEAACGWSGWITEAVFRRTGDRFPTSTGDELLASPETDACPRCDRLLFRTGISIRFEPSPDQTPPEGIAGMAYEVGEIEYE
jgi:hypothetical protein